VAKIVNRLPRLWLIIIFSFILRVLFLQTREIQYDDAFSILLSKQSLGEIISGTAVDTMPPLYYLLLHFWMIVSDNLAWLRFLGVLLSLGSVILLYILVRELVDEKAAFWAATLAGLSPLQIYHAQDLRMYSLLAISQLGYFWFFSRLFITKKPSKFHAWNWIGLVLTAAVAMYSHNLAVFGLVVPNIYLLIKRKWKSLTHLLLAQMGVMILAFPWMIMVPGQVEKIQRAFWTPRPGVVELLQAVVLVHGYLPLATFKMGLVLIIGIQIMIMISMEVWKNYRKMESVQFLAAVALLIPMELFITSYLMRPIFVTRGFIVSTLAYFGLAGAVIARSIPKGVGSVILGSFILSAAISLPDMYTFNSFPRSPFQEVTSYLKQIVQPGDLIVHDNKLSFFPVQVYDADLPQVFLPDETGSHNDTLAQGTQRALNLSPVENLDSTIENVSRVIFVVFQKSQDEFLTAGFSDHPVILQLKDHFRMTREVRFNDLLCIIFEP